MNPPPPARPYGLMLDTATLRAADNLVWGGAARDTRFIDVDAAALETVLKGIVLFPKVYVPKLEGSWAADSIGRFGDAFNLDVLDDAALEQAHESALCQLRHCGTVEFYARLVDSSPAAVRWGEWTHSGQATFLASIEVMQGIVPDTSAGIAINEWLASVSPDGEVGGIAEMPVGVVVEVWENAPRHWRKKRQYRLGDDHSLQFAGGASLSTTARGVNEDVVRFCKSLAWTAFRTLYYDAIAAAAGTPYMPHPVRSRFIGASLPHDIPRPASYAGVAAKYLDVLERVTHDAQTTAAEYLGSYYAKVPMPFLLPAVLRRAKSLGHAIETAYELRQSRGARNFRAHVSALAGAATRGDVTGILKLRDELERLERDCRASLHLTAQEKTNVAFNLFGFVSLQKPLTLPALSTLGLTRPRIRWLRDIFSDLNRVAGLGSLYDGLVRPYLQDLT